LITPKWPFVYQVYSGRLTQFCSDKATALPESIHCTVWKIFTVRSNRDTTNSGHQCPPGEDTGHSAIISAPLPPSNLQSHYHVIWACLWNKAGFSEFC
jgi:hypothetical protein